MKARKKSIENPRRTRPRVLKVSRKKAEITTAIRPINPVILFLRVKYFPLSLSLLQPKVPLKPLCLKHIDRLPKGKAPPCLNKMGNEGY